MIAIVASKVAPISKVWRLPHLLERIMRQATQSRLDKLIRIFEICHQCGVYAEGAEANELL